jgi:hypothetical protein
MQNMVDYLPWYGNYTNTIVRNNNIHGGFANEKSGQTKGNNTYDAMIKYVAFCIGSCVSRPEP